ncbi:TetR/AcrR family transcriptional regulator [Polycladomyces subterraneus]|uniref:WHG domain-containing protein n=1 Tax=Polycladomyces subterraneus TaxID=1016997 RepID=A0ABT8IK41_9BACL|nr:TetR/AcrR family transcriptional regulator [Polycladomyces subterraneus]MDN4593165.1 WHG domain-containing protein [Polycladomyces subterraneus]
MVAKAGLDRMTVVRTAAELADSLGLHQVTLAAVASRLGVRTPSLYNHVEGLGGLLRELALYGINKLGKRLERAAVGKATDDAVKAIMQAYRSFAREHPGLYEATLHAPDMNDTEAQRASEEVVNILLTVLEPFGLQKNEALHVVRGLRSLAHGFASLESAGAFGLPLDRDESYRLMVDLFLRGLNTICDDKSVHD